MRRFLAICVVTSVTVLAFAGGPGGASVRAGDRRCDALREVIPAAIGAATGNVSGAARHARALRELAGGELTPDRLRPALRRLARFFERAPELGLVERAQALGDLTGPLSRVVLFTALECDGSATTTTSRPLR